MENKATKSSSEIFLSKEEKTKYEKIYKKMVQKQINLNNEQCSKLMTIKSGISASDA